MIKTLSEQQEIVYLELCQYLKNKEAVAFCMDVVAIAHAWDDLVDKDKDLSTAQINDAFFHAMFGIRMNPFYQKYQAYIEPVMINAILQWQDANTLETGTDHEKHMAYMLRASILQLFNFCAYLVGGFQYAREVGPAMRNLYEETLESFMEEMKCRNL